MAELVLLELNELNFEVLQRLIARGVLPNFERLMRSHGVARTYVKEEYSKLEPWIQWVTAHTGKRQDQHGAFNLSDAQHSSLQQIWNVLERQGISTGVVSPMNARRGDAAKGFFIPDPWSVSDDSYPPQLAPLYKFLAERVQSHNVSLDQGSSKAKFAIAAIRAGMPLTATFRLAAEYVRAKLNPRRKWRLAAELDWFLWKMTLALRSKFGTAYTSVFLNSGAHYQHHYWTCHEPEYWGKRYPRLFGNRNPVAENNLQAGDDPVSFAFQTYDAMIGDAIKRVGEDSIMVLTGLSQIPFEGYAEMSGFYLYRPFDHVKTFDAIGIKSQRVAPLMSRDVMLYFASDAERATARRILDSARVDGRPLFLCTDESDARLFCKVHYSYDVKPDTEVIFEALPGKRLNFNEHFLLITFKTGHHSPEGFVIAPKFAFATPPVAGQTVPLEAVPEMVLRALRLRDSKQLALDLALSGA